jgi:diguanylate cyclase (GGDEF)-like protein/PAS domain S-box-containing protein
MRFSFTKFRHLSLTTSLLLVTVLLSLATYTVVMLGTDYRNHKMMLKRTLHLIERDMHVLQPQVDEVLALYGWDAAEHHLAAFSKVDEILRAVVVDGGMSVQASDQRLVRNRIIPALPPQFDSRSANAAIQENRLITHIDGNNLRIGAYFPQAIPPHRSGSNAGSVGVTFVLYDLTRFSDEMRKELQMQLVLVLGVGSLALLALLFYVRRTITRPLTLLAKWADRMAAGEYDKRLPETGGREIVKLAGAVNQFAASANNFKQDINRRHERLQAYLESGVVGMLVIDPEGRIQEMNGVLTDISGYTEDELYAEVWLELCHPEDRKGLYALWRRILAKPGKERSLEFRLCDKAANVHWIDAVAKYEQGSGDQAGRVLVFLRDVTLRKKNEADLRLAAAAFNTHEAIVITDATGSIVKVNQAFTDITGYESHEVLGKNPNMFQSGQHDRAFYARMWSDIRDKGVWKGEIYNRRKGGEIYPEFETIIAVKNPRGEVTQYIAFFEDITQRKNAEQRIQQLAYYDELTQLPNRRLLNERLEQALASAQRHNHLGALLFVDLDHFKDVNDSLGHLVGDKLLYEVAQRLAQHTRKEDTLARLGGDEFVLLVHCKEDPRAAAAEQVRQLGERIIADIARPYCIEGHTLRISVSIGISFFPSDSDNLADLLRQADTAMYQSKDSGRGVVRFFSEDMQHMADRRLLMRNDLRRALELEEFELYFQPQLDVLSGLPVGAECLIRWRHPKQGFIPPSDFIPAAEENGIIVEIGEWVLKKACQLLKRVEAHSCGRQALQLAVNISPLQFHSNGFVKTVKEIVDCYEVDARHLCFELTEGILVQNIDHAVDIIRDLKAMGISFAIDDFGTGYSSLGYLSRLPLDKIKVDKSFVDQVPGDPQGVTVVETILSMSQHLGVDVIAEGVESEEQLAFLSERYCHSYQGYLGARPMPLDQYLAFLNEKSGVASRGDAVVVPLRGD